MPVLGDLLGHDDALTSQAAQLLAKAFGADPGASAIRVYVPGRVEFLGKHTDYTGGRSLLMTVRRGFRLAVVGRDDRVLRVLAGPGDGDVQEFEVGRTPPHEPGHWVNYVATAARRIDMNFSAAVELRGADIAFVSDLPVAAGMSSSSALIVATFLTLSAINRIEQTDAFRAQIEPGDRFRLSEYLGCVENGQSFGSLAGEAGVGTFGGSEDHTSMLCCKPDTLTQCSFAPIAFEREIPFPAGVQIVLGSSGVQAVKTGAAMEQYNRASIRARKAAEAYNRAAGASCRHLRDVVGHAGPDGPAKAARAIANGTEPADADEDLPGRFEQFFREDQRIIPAVADALAAGDVGAIGELVDESHAGAVHGLQNQIDETNFLQSAARELGALAASGFGAGFGGSVWAMVPDEQVA
ncbi:MAG: GHMP family kinase ATP-binding protein, partial [Planctomycetota bacterium]